MSSNEFHRQCRKARILILANHTFEGIRILNNLKIEIFNKDTSIVDWIERSKDHRHSRNLIELVFSARHTDSED